MNIVIYARFSRHTRTEQSIEGQSCYEYDIAHGLNVIEEYIDRTQSTTSDNRSSFQRIINDSVHHIQYKGCICKKQKFCNQKNSFSPLTQE